MKTKNPQFSRSSVPKITYIASMEGIAFTPAAARIYVKEACMLTVINSRMFSLIRNDDTNTYPQAPTARVIEQSMMETIQLVSNLLTFLFLTSTWYPWPDQPLHA